MILETVKQHKVQAEDDIAGAALVPTRVRRGVRLC